MREMRKRYPNEHIFKSFNGPFFVINWICTTAGAESLGFKIVTANWKNSYLSQSHFHLH